jgi:hypothetical protein
LAVHKVLWVLVGVLLIFPSIEGDAEKRKSGGGDGEVNVPAERPFDSVNIFGDLGTSFRLPGTEENRVWWERMVSGEVGKDRFLILCALKDGNWRKLGDIRDFVEFQLGSIYPVEKLYAMVFLMAGRQRSRIANGKFRLIDGEGWLEKNREASFAGIESEWRIEPSVFPLLYFLLMGCPEENRCR